MANTVKMVMDRDYVLRSTLGHILTFKKGKPKDVPAIMVETAAEVGAKRVDGEPAFAEPEAQPATPVDPAKRNKDVRAAIEAIVEKNARDDFTAGGTPKVAAVSRETGYKVDQTEVARIWAKYNEDKLNESE